MKNLCILLKNVSIFLREKVRFQIGFWDGEDLKPVLNIPKMKYSGLNRA